MSYYLYVFFPVLFFTLIASTYRCVSWPTSLMISIGYLVGLELIVLGYIHRQIFSVLFIALALYHYGKWSFLCIAMAVFPLLPSEYGDDLILVYIGAAILVVYTCRAYRIQAFVLALSAILVFSTMQFLEAKEKPPILLPMLSWIVAFGSIPLGIYLTNPKESKRNRFITIALALSPMYVLLSISYEVLFFVVLCLTLLEWIEIETKNSEIRMAFMFLLFTKIAFFGTGNVASMSSFEISSTYRFVTVFSPFTMGALLILKILVPFTLVTAAFQLVCDNPHRYFLLVLAMSDILSINFFFLVRDEGSWKEIGNSISMFGIVNAQIVFLPLLFIISNQFTKSYKIKDKDH